MASFEGELERGGLRTAYEPEPGTLEAEQPPLRVGFSDRSPEGDDPCVTGGQAGAYTPPPKVSIDQEVWVKAQVKTAIRAALFLSWAQQVQADQGTIMCGIDGIANGAAVEIIRTLGMEPPFVNLRKPPLSDNIGHGKLINP